jgi:drug/metabolite transporter (DMT)-like permease
MVVLQAACFHHAAAFAPSALAPGRHAAVRISDGRARVAGRLAGTLAMQQKPEKGASKSIIMERPGSSLAQDDVAASLERALASTPEEPRSWLDADTTTCRIYILIAALLCGTNFPAVKLLQESLDPAALLSARFLLASVAMTPLLKGATKEAVFEGLETGAWLALGYITQAIALETAQAGTTAFLCSLTTVVCPVIEKLTGSKVSKQAWAAALLAVVGAGILELGGGAQPGVGDLWGLMQPIGFGIFFWKTEQAMKRHPDQALPITTAQVYACALGGLLWTAAQGHDLSGIIAAMSDFKLDLALLWIGLASTALILVLETIALGVLPSSETAVVFSSEPLWGTLFATLLIHEAVTKDTVVGGALIIGACLLRVVDLGSLQQRLRSLTRR